MTRKSTPTVGKGKKTKSGTTRRKSSKDPIPHPHIESLPAAEAMRRAARNRLRRYPSPDRDGERLYPLAEPNVRPSFEIAPDDTIFTIGSCFARNVEKVLERAGKRILSREFDLGAFGESIGDAANFFNKYSIHSITNEIGWALDRKSFPGEALLYQTGDDEYFDLQLGSAKLTASQKDILSFRHEYLDVIAKVAQADVVIITLGYVETWYDTVLDLYLNIAPPPQMIKADPDRFVFRVLSYRDIIEGLERLHALLLAHRSKPLKMLLTVSPVPLLSTFRDMDVLVANAYSKSVQRAAIDEFIANREGIDYFPSYEFVTLSNPEIAWSRGDYRHVSPDIVTRIMSNVLSRYVPDSTTDGMADNTLLSSARLMFKLGRFPEVLTLVDQHREQADQDVEVLHFEAQAARRIGNMELDYTALDKIVRLAPERPVPLEHKILACRPTGRIEEAAKLLAHHASRFPARGYFRDKIDWAG